jgi:hypothetical protein
MTDALNVVYRHLHPRRVCVTMRMQATDRHKM